MLDIAAKVSDSSVSSPPAALSSPGLDPLPPVEDLVVRYAPMVSAMARPYAKVGVPFQDLTQEGALGLLDAAERFDPEHGTSFATYARWWVRYRMQRYLRRNRAMVALPQTRAIRRVRRKLRAVTARLEAERSAAVTAADIAEALDVDVEDVELVQAELASRDVEITPGRDPRGRLDAPDGTPEEEAARREARGLAHRLVGAVLDRLDDREKLIVSERRLTDSPRSLRELGKRLSISAERVRQLEKRAFRKMRDGLEERGLARTAQACAVAV